MRTFYKYLGQEIILRAFKEGKKQTKKILGCQPRSKIKIASDFSLLKQMLEDTVSMTFKSSEGKFDQEFYI